MYDNSNATIGNGKTIGKYKILTDLSENVSDKGYINAFPNTTPSIFNILIFSTLQCLQD